MSSTIVLPALKGTPKQIAWAVDIRRQKVTEMEALPNMDVLRHLTSAADWIKLRHQEPESIIRYAKSLA